MMGIFDDAARLKSAARHWISVNDSLPDGDDRTRKLVWHGDPKKPLGRDNNFGLAFFDGAHWKYSEWDKFYARDVTHWANLVKP